LVSRDFEFADYAVLPDRVSDHLAVVAELKRASRSR
jgi:endonuclease/exonuclease/phosphatase family metal-dependent hydrolase